MPSETCIMPLITHHGVRCIWAAVHRSVHDSETTNSISSLLFAMSHLYIFWFNHVMMKMILKQPLPIPHSGTIIIRRSLPIWISIKEGYMYYHKLKVVIVLAVLRWWKRWIQGCNTSYTYQ